MKKWFIVLMTLMLCMLMGTAFAEAYKIENRTLYVIDYLNDLPEGDYDSICVNKGGTLELDISAEVSKNVTNYGIIQGGTFKGDVTNYEYIKGGTFFGTVLSNNRGRIEGGTFHAAVNSRENCKIQGGTFTVTSEVSNVLRSEITGGEFSGKVFNGNTGIGGREGIISGGIFTKTSEVTNGRKGIIKDGATFYGKLYYLIVIKTSEFKNSSTVIASVDGTNANKAMEKETVCLTVAPEANYELGTLTVTSEDGSDIALSKVGNSDYRFTMPASVIYVTASFNECTKIPVLPETGDPSAPTLWLSMSILSMAGVLLLRKKAYSR